MKNYHILKNMLGVNEAAILEWLKDELSYNGEWAKHNLGAVYTYREMLRKFSFMTDNEFYKALKHLEKAKLITVRKLGYYDSNSIYKITCLGKKIITDIEKWSSKSLEEVDK